MSLTLKQGWEMTDEQRSKLSQQQLNTVTTEGQRHRRRELAKRRKAAYAATGDAKVAAVDHYMLLLNSQERIADRSGRDFLDDLPDQLTLTRRRKSSGRYSSATGRHAMQRVGVATRANPDLSSRRTVSAGIAVGIVPRIEGAISWTTDKEIARTFACGHRGIRNPDPVIAVATIVKADIFAATNERRESEVLCLPRVTAILDGPE
jgi:hypothetical protein